MTDYCPICGREIEDPEFGCEPCNNAANWQDEVNEDLRLIEREEG